MSAGLLAVALVAMSCGGADDGDGAVLLESATSAGNDPFTSSVAKGAIRISSTRDGVAKDGGAVDGGTPGLYGGTRDLGTCDKEKLVQFLSTNPDKAEAWAAVLKVDAKDIAGYVGRLLPLVLLSDTRVTNHGFKNGRATPLQSVLQAGTAVLVDDHGVPRVKCACGNPLLPPKGGGTKFTGVEWPGFDEDDLLVISASDEPLPDIVVIDIETDTPFTVKHEDPPPDVDPPPTTTPGDESTTTSRPSESTTTSRPHGPTTSRPSESTTTSRPAATTTTSSTAAPATTTTTVRPTTTTVRPTTTTVRPTTTTVKPTTTCVQGPVSCN